MALKPEDQSQSLFLNPLPLAIQNVTKTLVSVGIILEIPDFKALCPGLMS